jgi:methenyltetrahydromethanopterin cyclohydrolase
MTARCAIICASMTDLRMNDRAYALADGCAERTAELRIAVTILPGGARVIDAGADAPGGLAAGKLLA